MAVQYYIYESATGRLVSVGSELPKKLKAGLTSKAIDDDQANQKIWDEASEALVNPPGRRVLKVEELLARFTERELQGLLGLSEKDTRAELRALSRFVRLSPFINMDGPIYTDALAALVGMGLISAARSVELSADG